MKGVSFNEVCRALWNKYPDIGKIARLLTRSGNVVSGGVIAYRTPGKDILFRAKNNGALLQKVNSSQF